MHRATRLLLMTVPNDSSYHESSQKIWAKKYPAEAGLSIRYEYRLGYSSNNLALIRRAMIFS